MMAIEVFWRGTVSVGKVKNPVGNKMREKARGGQVKAEEWNLSLCLSLLVLLLAVDNRKRIVPSVSDSSHRPPANLCNTSSQSNPSGRLTPPDRGANEGHVRYGGD